MYPIHHSFDVNMTFSGSTLQRPAVTTIKSLNILQVKESMKAQFKLHSLISQHALRTYITSKFKTMIWKKQMTTKPLLGTLFTIQNCQLHCLMLTYVSNIV